MIKIEPNLPNGLSKISTADCFQVRSVSEVRFIKRVGVIDNSTMSDIRIALAKVFSIND